MTTSLDDQYAVVVAEAQLYESTWWALPHNEMAARRLRRLPALRTALRVRAENGYPITSRDVFADGLTWDDERAGFHGDLLDNLVGKARETGLPPHVYFTLGSPGSGKTHTLRQVAIRHARAAAGRTLRLRVSDPDAVREALPEYAEGKGAGILQDEVVVVAYGEQGYPAGGGMQQLVLDAAPGSSILLVDVVGSPTGLPPTVVALADDGWSVFLLLADCPPDVCLQRVKQRAVDSGRIVDLDYVRNVKNRPTRALRAGVQTGRVTGWARIDTQPRRSRILESDRLETFGAVGDRAI